MLTLHTGSAEVEARLLLLDCDELAPGEQAWAQLRLAEAVAAVRGDRLVLRTPDHTVAGGEILDTHPERHRRHDRKTIDRLEGLSSATPGRALVAVLRSIEPATLSDVARALGVSEAQSQEGLLESQVITLNDGLLFTREGFEALSLRSREVVSAYHARHPLRRGMAREELRARLNVNERTISAALSRWVEEGRLRVESDAVSLPDFAPAPSSAQQREADAFLTLLEESPFSPRTDERPPADLLAYLIEQRRVVDVGDGVMFAWSAYDQMVARVTEHLRREGSITLAQARDMFETSRRYAQALLEHLDRERITRRIGDERVLRER